MEPALLLLLAVLVLVASVGAAFFVLAKKTAQAADSAQSGQEDDVANVANVAGNRAARRQGARARIGAANLRHRHQAAQPGVRNVADESDSQEGSDGESGSEEEEGGRRRESKKDRRRRERREAQEAREEARRADEERRAQPSAYEERRRQREAEREAKEREQEEELKRIAEERQRREDEEASKWLGQIIVEGEGEEVDAAQNTASVLGQFVDYITSRKTVPLEQLAMDFKLRTTDVIERIRVLEEQGRLTGVMDDRGKYIYISPDEMKSVAEYLTSKGRVSITDLAAKSATLIDLEPKAASATALHAQNDIDFDTLVDA